MNPTPQFDLLGLGLNARDEIFRLPGWPGPGEKVRWSERHTCAGGQVAVACLTARRLGMRVSYAGSIGDDEAGAWQADWLAGEGIDSSRLRRVSGCGSQQAWILVENGERTIFYDRPEGLVYPAAEVDAAWIASGRALHLDGHDGAAAARAAVLARAAGVTVSVDLARMHEGQREATRCMLAHTDHLVASASLLEGALPEAGLRAWREQYGMQVAAVTLGAAGVLALDDAGFTYVPGFEVAAVNTTGAGDVFHGAYLAGLLQGWPLAERLEFAAAQAALQCTGWSAANRIAPASEVARLRRDGRRIQRA